MSCTWRHRFRLTPLGTRADGGLEACEGMAQRFFEKLYPGLEIAADFKSRAPGTERRADVSF